MEEKISIEFTEEEIDSIKSYMDYVNAIDIKTAIMDAVNVAYDAKLIEDDTAPLFEE